MHHGKEIHFSAPSKRLSPKLAQLVLLLLIAFSGYQYALAVGPNALPTGGVVATGAANISAPNPGQMNITQTKDKTSINWSSFDIGSSARVNITQPNANSILLNRINSGSASLIDGALNANGQVILINPNGFTFGRGSQVSSAGTIVSTLGLSDQNFNDGKFTFSGMPSGVILNQGTLSTTDPSGYIALLGPTITNEGSILARVGGQNTIALASAQEVTLFLDQRQLMGLRIDQASYNGMITNRGMIQLDGGLVLLAAASANQISSLTINDSGLITADSLISNAGQINLVVGNSSQRIYSESLTEDAYSQNPKVLIMREPDHKEDDQDYDHKVEIGAGKPREEIPIKSIVGEVERESPEGVEGGEGHNRERHNREGKEKERDEIKDHDKERDEHETRHHNHGEHHEREDHDKEPNNQQPVPWSSIAMPTDINPIPPSGINPIPSDIKPIPSDINPAPSGIGLSTSTTPPSTTTPSSITSVTPVSRGSAGCSLFIDRSGSLINNCESPKK